ncbi:MAG: rhodanese-like domain-containing protein [Deltaproteobacteria bacterium]|nr:MAG: rhodanese-like domain-containing protein [Deltaproteobacteria bacterium]
MKLFLVISLFLIPVLGFSQGVRIAQEAFHQANDNEAIVLDVREKWEIKNTGMALGARWIPISAIRFKKREWMVFLKTFDKKKVVYVYSRSGGRAAQVVRRLRKRGFKAKNIGGLRDWKKAGLPIKRVRN